MSLSTTLVFDKVIHLHQALLTQDSTGDEREGSGKLSDGLKKKK